MSKSKRVKKPVKRLTANQLMSRTNGFAGIDKIKTDQVQSRLVVLKNEISHVYEMSNKFVTVDIKAYIDRKLAEEQDLIKEFPNAQTLPYHITIGAYGYQDLAIALNLSHVFMAEMWSFEAYIYLKKEDEYEVVEATVPYSLTLPAMTHPEFLDGKRDCKIDHGHGLKTVGWKGFNNEVLKKLKSYKEFDEDFGIERIEVEIKADVKFLNTAAYEEFMRIQKWVNAGHDVAEIELRNLWIREQRAGSKAKTIGYEDVA